MGLDIPSLLIAYNDMKAAASGGSSTCWGSGKTEPPPAHRLWGVNGFYCLWRCLPDAIREAGGDRRILMQKNLSRLAICGTAHSVYEALVVGKPYSPATGQYAAAIALIPLALDQRLAHAEEAIFFHK